MENTNNNSNTKEIDMWKKKLLDLGKRNNLINYKDSKSSTLEVLSPAFSSAFDRIISNASIQIYDDKFEESDDVFSDDKIDMNREQFLMLFQKKVSSSQLLLYNQYQKTKRILKSLMKKASDAITERGVNILYIAFGFVAWKESAESNIEYKAPILLVPITISNDAVNKPYYIHHFDDDINTNTTFQYLLENQYGINIPSYDDEDLEEYISKIEEQVSTLGWKVIREARISIFSFNKLNMYLDLENNASKISENPNVAALTNAEVNSDIFINNDELDEMSKTRDLFAKQHNVVDADFSQTEAIEYAMMGKSFVLQGPPGTGKSQTITNMIAELIYAGKKVLFVSEKMAALEVVYNNLKKAKLSDFCLELHSYKANKKDFIEDLYNTLNTPKTHVSSSADDNVTSMRSALDKINKYDSELYKIYKPIDMSLYQLIGLANHYINTKEVPFIINDISSLGKEELSRNCNLVNKYASYEKSVGYNYKNHPLYGLNINDASYAFKLQLSKNLEDCKNNCSYLIADLKEIKSNYNLSLLTSSEIKDFIDFVRFCSNNNFTDNAIYNSQFIDSLISSIDELKELEDSINNISISILKKYDKDIFNQDFKELYDDFSIYGNSFFKRLFNSRFKFSNLKLASYRLNHKKVKYNEAIDDLRLLMKRSNNLNKYDELIKLFKNASISQFKYLDTNWILLKDLLNKLKSKLFDKSLLSKDSYKDISFKLHDDKLINKLELNYNKLINSENLIENIIDTNIFDYKNLNITDKMSKYDLYLNNLSSLDVWVEFNKLYKELLDNNLISFIDMVIKYNYSLDKISDYYKLCFYRQWIDFIFKNNSNLNNYSRFEHESDVKTFSSKDKMQLSLSRAIINEKLSKLRPDPLIQMSGSPASILMREHEKKRKIKPIRMLMKEIPDFIQSLKPCFLMSPLSVSTFLPDDMEFDVTIFDEASQVFPEDAIVAIYRAKQLIVVGDSKQMPPTNFFMASDNDDEEYDEEISDIDSYESILDLCTTTFPTKSLLCHYRSKDEGLINFSNKNFYKYNLVTYPSVHENRKDLGVDFVYVENGVLDSRSKVNVLEAEKVVDLVFEHFRKYPKRSLGVVAFNIRQQDAILKLLDKRRANDPSLEDYFKKDVEEPFFVKNLETVQGDERDTIIFSVTYAKNDKGQFALRFGPLNLVGGERRLNVAVTRAKLNVKVVSSIRAYDIDISRVTNNGPKLLHDYLDYAEHGVTALDRAISVNENEEFDSPFEQDVYEFLKDNGFDVTTQVGCSRYRIDLGLKRPETSDYVLAIECDGATYHSSKSARDRDRLRQSILESMDWKFYRIWSTDWYKNNKVEKQALLEACKKALEDNSNYNNGSNNEKTLDISYYLSKEDTKGSVKLFDKYIPVDKNRTFYNANFAAEEYTKVEGPVAVDYLLKHICNIWGYEKATQNVKKIFKNNFISTSLCSLENGFLYGPDQKNYAMREKIGLYLGDINYVSDYEIRNGMYAAIEANVSCKKDALFAFVREQLGFVRVGDKITRKLESSFNLLKPYILIDSDGDITINKNNSLKIIRRKTI